MENIIERLFKLFSLPYYNGWTKEKIASDYSEYNLKDLKKELKEDNYYHERIEESKSYKLFGDVDHYDKSFEEFARILIDFMWKGYGIKIEMSDIRESNNIIK